MNEMATACFSCPIVSSTSVDWKYRKYDGTSADYIWQDPDIQPPFKETGRFEATKEREVPVLVIVNTSLIDAGVYECYDAHNSRESHRTVLKVSGKFTVSFVGCFLH